MLKSKLYFEMYPGLQKLNIVFVRTIILIRTMRFYFAP